MQSAYHDGRHRLNGGCWVWRKRRFRDRRSEHIETVHRHNSIQYRLNHGTLPDLHSSPPGHEVKLLELDVDATR